MNGVRDDVMRSETILNAFSNNSSGNLTSAEVDKAVTYDSGPEIIFRDDPGGMKGADGFYNASNNQIELATNRLDDLEAILAADPKIQPGLAGGVAGALDAFEKLGSLTSVYTTCYMRPFTMATI